MTLRILAAGCAALTLIGCVEIANIGDGATAVIAPAENFIDVPEQVRSAVSPNQDLSAVKIDPVDGCYVYRYVGPVETTFLPLRTVDGRPICARAEEALATG